MSRTIRTIWIVNKYAMPPQYESRLRAIKFAQYLVDRGYKVTVFGSSSMHNMDINLITNKTPYVRKQYGNIDFVHIKARSYKKTAGLNRILSEFDFFYRLRFHIKEFEKPDCIIETGGPLITNPILGYAKKHHIPFILEILDVWPDDFVDFGLISPHNPIMKILYAQTKYNYVHSDALVFSWSGCYKYLEQKGWATQCGGKVDLNKVYYINNGVDLNDFNKWKHEYTLDDADLNSNYKKIIYLGSIRLANDIMKLVKAAELLLHNREDCKVLIYGNGEDRERLVEYCKSHHLSNIIFKDKWIDPKYVPFILSQGYINILNYTEKFGIYGISSSKLFQYMASGRPIVCNINIFDCPITKYQIGLAKKFSSALEYADAITSILNMPNSEYDAMCQRTINAAKEYDYEYLTQSMINVINQTTNNL